ncbi:MAG: BamA/TamA family outer membrane protein [Pseudomonadota bacterium]
MIIHFRPFELRSFKLRTACFSSLLLCAGPTNAAEAQETDPPVQSTENGPSDPAPREEKIEAQEIIGDDTFQAALPELVADDPELLEALEPIDAFERRFDALTSEPVEPTVSDAEASDPAANAPPPAAPLEPQFIDPALAAPLPPLEDFEALPLDFAPPSAAPVSPSVALTYSWSLRGLADADLLTGTDMYHQFEELSALENGDGEAANIAMLVARVNDDMALLNRLLKSEGWYRPLVKNAVEAGEPGDKVAAKVAIEVERGPRFTLSQIVIDAQPTVPKGLIEDTITLKVGDPIIASRILINEALIATRLPQNGYPFAAIGARDIALDAGTAGGEYTLPVTVGPRAKFGGFQVSGDAVFDPEHLGDIARFERGELYDSRWLDDLRRALAATTLLRSFSVEPKETGEDAGEGTEYVTIAVDQTAGPARTLAGSVGYGAGQGFRLEGSWAHRNLFPPEGALTASLIAGTLEQGGSLSFRRANAGQRDRTFEVNASALRSNFDAFEAVTGRVGATYSYVSTPIWQKRITYAFGVEALASVEDAFDVEAGAFADQTYFIGAAFAQVGFDTSDDLLNPTRGLRLEALVQPEGSLDGGFTPYVRTILDATAYNRVGDKIVLAGRARLGTLQGADGVDIAPSRRLYAGGGGSVRGFGFQELGPRVQAANPDFDPTDPESEEPQFTLEPIGGRSVIEASAEARYRFGDYGVVAFVDAGQVYRDTVPTFEDIRFGVGVGGRIYTAFGPLRVDVATPINRRAGESRINVYVSIGQAF